MSVSEFLKYEACRALYHFFMSLINSITGEQMLDSFYHMTLLNKFKIALFQHDNAKILLYTSDI